MLDLSVAAVKSRLHRARVRVREALAPDPADAPPPNEGCPDVLSLYSRHLEGEISQELCAQMERHLAGCPRCRGQCDALKQTLSLCRSAPALPVPEATQRAVRSALRAFLELR